MRSSNLIALLPLLLLACTGGSKATGDTSEGVPIFEDHDSILVDGVDVGSTALPDVATIEAYYNALLEPSGVAVAVDTPEGSSRAM